VPEPIPVLTSRSLDEALFYMGAFWVWEGN